MIILITGASHVGKTALAQRLLEKYGYPYLSIADQDRHMRVLRKAESDRSENRIPDIREITFRHTVSDDRDHRHTYQNERVNAKRPQYNR